MEEFFCKPCLAAMPAAKFWIGVGAVVILALVALLYARKSFVKARLIEDMPTSRVRSASQGYVELIGTAVTRGQALAAPLTSRDCLWWRYKVERYQRSGKSSSWRTIDSGISDAPFYMRDETGICRIEPDGAEVSCLHKKVWRGSSRMPASASITAKPRFLDKLNPVIGYGRYRYTEYLIRDGDPLYLLGHFVSDATGKRVLTIDQVAGRIVREWKNDYDNLLVTYDADGNGTLDEQEWGKVRSAARSAAMEQQRETAGGDIDHTLMKPESGGLPFLIGSHGQEALSTRFRWHALGGAVVFLAVGAFATWQLASRFSG